MLRCRQSHRGTARRRRLYSSIIRLASAGCVVSVLLVAAVSMARSAQSAALGGCAVLQETDLLHRWQRLLDALAERAIADSRPPLLGTFEHLSMFNNAPCSAALATHCLQRATYYAAVRLIAQLSLAQTATTSHGRRSGLADRYSVSLPGVPLGAYTWHATLDTQLKANSRCSVEGAVLTNDPPCCGLP